MRVCQWTAAWRGPEKYIPSGAQKREACRGNHDGHILAVAGSVHRSSGAVLEATEGDSPKVVVTICDLVGHDWMKGNIEG